jgi:serralysin
MLHAIEWGGWRWSDGATPGTHITFAFTAGGVDLAGWENGTGPQTSDSVGWSAAGMQTAAAALDKWAEVANLSFSQVTTYAAANFVENLFYGNDETSIGGDDWTGVRGAHETPDVAHDADGKAWGIFNVDDGIGLDTIQGLIPGARGFQTLVHEFGHALGLAHPHDNGGGSSVFPGVTAAHGDIGTFGLNQRIFTIMSYNDGWNVTGQPSEFFGLSSGPMAFDIAAIQNLYGARPHNTGNNTYVLRHVGGQPDDLSCIWDTGGTDQIVYGGKFPCTINLNAATLAFAPGGGGFPSYANGAPKTNLDHWNAFTIAHGVKIENASGGAAGDHLTGNQYANRLDGLGGHDILTGGPGKDILRGGTANDFFDFNARNESVVGTNRDQILDFSHLQGDKIDLSGIDADVHAGGNQGFHYIGTHAFTHHAGELRFSGHVVRGDVNGDAHTDFEIFVNSTSLAKTDFLL